MIDLVRKALVSSFQADRWRALPDAGRRQSQRGPPAQHPVHLFESS